ncbi:MAG: DUF2254 domain-containing protein [Miltoncostaeaceae bacterium]
MRWRLRNRLRELAEASIWPIPVAITVAAFLLADATIAVDAANDDAVLIFDPTTATALLAAIAAAMITFTGFVFSVLLLVVQFASGQFTPRVLRTAYRDRLTQVALGIFVGTFVYTLNVLSEIRDEAVPTFAVSVAILFVLISVILFIALVSRVSKSMRAPRIADTVVRDGLDAIARTCGPHGGPDAPGRALPADADDKVAAEETGILRAVDRRGLARLARNAGAEIELRRAVGDHLGRGTPLFIVRGGEIPAARLRRRVIVADERAIGDDPLFALRIVVDIAARALSPGVNDPTTAVQAIDRVQTLLEALVDRDLPGGDVCDGDGSPLLREPQPTWGDVLELGIDEIATYGADSEQVMRRLRALLADLTVLAPPGERREATRARLAALGESAPADWQGLGLARPLALAD